MNNSKGRSILKRELDKPERSRSSIEPRYTSASAFISPCQQYRYHLRRSWVSASPGPWTNWPILWCMLNPSTADHRVLDPTLRRCLGYTMRWRYGAMEVVNLYGYRATDPRGLLGVPDPVGNPLNDQAILDAAKRAAMVVVGWGAGIRRIPGGLERQRAVYDLLASVNPHVYRLRVTQDGIPWHPLYLPGDLQPVPWTPRAAR